MNSLGLCFSEEGESNQQKTVWSTELTSGFVENGSIPQTLRNIKEVKLNKDIGLPWSRRTNAQTGLVEH